MMEEVRQILEMPGEILELLGWMLGLVGQETKRTLEEKVER